MKLSRALSLRLAERQLIGLLSQEPPRSRVACPFFNALTQQGN
ncbi:hypothetical protein [Oscillatoria acuminata]|nr:hypothetical protein [Oscillatoria acuminata]